MRQVNPQLSIIIPSYNTKELLEQCLASVYRQTKRVSFEVIVVDNGSRDGSPALVKQAFPQAKLVKVKENLGFGKANNLGAAKAEGDWLLFLNSDTQIIFGAIDKLADRIRNSGNMMVWGPKLLNRDGSLQPSAGYFPTLGRIAAQMLFLDDLPILGKLMKPYQQTAPGFYKREQAVDWVTGAALLVHRLLYKKVKGFDEHYFMYAEEVDLCFRLKKAGALVYFTPQGQLTHLKGASSQDGFTAAIVGEYRGLVSFFARHRPGWQLPLVKFLLRWGALLRLVVFGIINREKTDAYKQALNIL
jgi:hypothetical protein